MYGRSSTAQLGPGTMGLVALGAAVGTTVKPELATTGGFPGVVATAPTQNIAGGSSWLLSW